MPPPSGGETSQGTRQGTKGASRTFLHTSSSQATWPRPPFTADRPGPQRQVLVVRYRRETDTPPSVHPVQTVVPRGSKDVAES